MRHLIHLMGIFIAFMALTTLAGPRRVSPRSVPGGFPSKIPDGPEPNGWHEVLHGLVQEEETFRGSNTDIEKFYKWLFKNVKDTPQAKTRHLANFRGILDALKHSHKLQNTVPKTLTPLVRERLLIEADFKYYFCVRDAIDTSIEAGAYVDQKVMIEQCREKYMFIVGHEVIQGKLSSQTEEALRIRLTEIWIKCRERDESRAECLKQSTVVVDGKTYKARPGFFSEGNPNPGLSTTPQRPGPGSTVPSSPQSNSLVNAASKVLTAFDNAFKRTGGMLAPAPVSGLRVPAPALAS